MNSSQTDIYNLFIEDEERIRYNITSERDKSFIQNFMDIQQQNVDITKATPEAYQQMAGAFTKGVVQGTLGLPADVVGLATGLMNMLTDDPEGKGNLQQFAEGYGTVPFTSEKISEFLTSLGWSYDEELTKGAELLGEVVAPGSVGTKATETAIKGSGEVGSTLKTNPIEVTGKKQ